MNFTLMRHHSKGAAPLSRGRVPSGVMVKGKKTRTAVYHPPPFLVMTVSPEGVTPRLAS